MPKGKKKRGGGNPQQSSRPSPSDNAPKKTVPTASQKPPQQRGGGNPQQSSRPSSSDNAPKQTVPPAAPKQAAVPQSPAQQVPSNQNPQRSESDRMKQLSLASGISLAQRPAQKANTGRSLNCFVNHWKFNIGTSQVYQYDTSFEPELERTKSKNALLNSVQELQNNQFVFDGKMLFATVHIPNGIYHPTTTFGGTAYTVTIVQTNVIDLSTPDMPLQVYNLLFKKILRLLKFEPVGRQYFNPAKPTKIPQFSIELWPGYFTRINPTLSGIVLIADLAHKVLRTDTVLDQLENFKTNSKSEQNYRDRATSQLRGQIVLTRYNNRTYRIDGIEWNLNPLSTFQYQNSNCTYVQYYTMQHHLKISDHKQPLLIHQQRRKSGEKIYLIPELCSMTGLTEDLTKNFNTMKELGKHTRVSPEGRSAQLLEFVQSVNSSESVMQQLDQWKVTLTSKPTSVQARQLPFERLKLGKITTLPSKNAEWIPKTIEEPMPLRNWILVYPQQNEKDAQALCTEILRNTKELGMPTSDPTFVEVKNIKHGLPNEYEKMIRNHVDSQTDMVVCLLPFANTTPVYDRVKTLCCVELGIPSQCVKPKTISGHKKGSICPKIVQQMNCKLGGQLWQVQIPLRGTMIVGIDVCHDTQSNMGRGSRSVVGFCATTNSAYTKYYSTVTFQGIGKEIVEELTRCMKQALASFSKINSSFPANVIVYRDGVGEGQFTEVLNFEVPQIHEAFGAFNIKPNLSVIVVQKRIHTRVFHNDKGIANPPPGTVIDTDCVSPDSYDFYLISQHVNQGTVTPTHYRIIHNEFSSLSPDHYQQLTYKLCYLYYNWSGTIRVPAPCHYAHKIAFLVGQSIHDTPSEALANKLYFL